MVGAGIFELFLEVRREHIEALGYVD